MKCTLEDMLILVALKCTEYQHRSRKATDKQNDKVIINRAAMACILCC